MKRSEAIEKLRNQADAIRALGATSLYLFGSVARDEAGPASDVDLFIDYDPARKFSGIVTEDNAAIGGMNKPKPCLRSSRKQANQSRPPTARRNSRPSDGSRARNATWPRSYTGFQPY